MVITASSCNDERLARDTIGIVHLFVKHGATFLQSRKSVNSALFNALLYSSEHHGLYSTHKEILDAMVEAVRSGKINTQGQLALHS